VSFNLRNFPHETRDRDRLARVLDTLDADVFVFQEVHAPDELSALLPDHVVVASHGGGRHGQRLAIAYDPRTIVAAGPPREVDDLSLGGRVRPGFVLPLGTALGPITAVAVHLKAGRPGWPRRHEQWTHLQRLLARTVADGEVVIVAGDFNVVGGRDPEDPDEALERERLVARLAVVGLRPALDVGQCTAYWEGVRRDDWWVPSQLDHAFVSALVPTSAWVGGHCARHDCDPVHSSRPHPDRDLGLISDHCPVVIDLGDFPDEP
jgi:endonuclease/exonuclease/phosphatase family metal-dependent hydrolase